MPLIILHTDVIELHISFLKRAHVPAIKFADQRDTKESVFHVQTEHETHVNCFSWILLGLLKFQPAKEIN